MVISLFGVHDRNDLMILSEMPILHNPAISLSAFSSDVST
jgi:hypothetical protein